MSVSSIFLLIILGILFGFACLFVILVHLGFFNDPDGKESNPEYWETLKEMRAKEQEGEREVRDE